MDIANNRRDYLTFYHDVISTESWEMRFLGSFWASHLVAIRYLAMKGGHDPWDLFFFFFFFINSMGSLKTTWLFLFLSIVSVLSTKNNAMRRIHPCRYVTVALKTMNTFC
jgi:hypothetical protein